MIIKEFKVSKIIFLLALAITISCVNNAVWSQQKTASAEEKREAEKAWEALIKAKGGREKLYSITNMLTEVYLGSVKMKGGLETVDFNDTKLDIFPSRHWDFYIDMSGRPTVGRWDADNPPGEFVTLGYPNGKNENVSAILSGVISEQRIPFLLETKWNKPELVRVNRIKKDKKLFDVIETIVEGNRMDFIFEPEEMLVTEVKFYIDGELISNYLLSNYTTIDGIKMPQAFDVGDESDNFKPKPPATPIIFKFNVEYDSQLFERPLTITNRDAWKSQKPTN